MHPRKWKGTGLVIRGEIVGAGALHQGVQEFVAHPSEES
jgi:hypothetical protein